MKFRRQVGAVIGVEYARTVVVCGNENTVGSLRTKSGWQTDVETSCCNITICNACGDVRAYGEGLVRNSDRLFGLAVCTHRIDIIEKTRQCFFVRTRHRFISSFLYFPVSCLWQILCIIKSLQGIWIRMSLGRLG